MSAKPIRPRNDFADVALRHEPAALRRTRPKNRRLGWSLLALSALVVYAWLSGEIGYEDMFSARRAQNLERFLAVDFAPFELRDQPFSLASTCGWAWRVCTERGFEGALATLSMSVLSITLAALGATSLLFFAARNVATARPFELEPETSRWRRRSWIVLTSLTRALLIFLRAIPEYIWAFLLLAMLGANAWPAVLALAIHNAGILGKLGAETVENLDARPPRALRLLGATRGEIAIGAIFPLFLSRFLLYFFYRFETCVREATVLGMLGVVSLGYWIQDARSRQFYDQMLVLIALGAGIVLVADLVSAFVRARIRNAS